MFSRNISDILYPVLEYYLHAKIIGVKREESCVHFVSSIGEGEMRESSSGNWDIFVSDENMGMIEKEVFDLLTTPENQPDLVSYYENMKELSTRRLNHTSKSLVKDIIKSVEFLIMNVDVKLENGVAVGPFFVYSHKGEKKTICLN